MSKLAKSANSKTTHKPAMKLKNAWGRGTEGKLASELGAKIDTDNDPTGAPKCKRGVTPLNDLPFRPAGDFSAARKGSGSPALVGVECELA